MISAKLGLCFPPVPWRRCAPWLLGAIICAISMGGCGGNTFGSSVPIKGQSTSVTVLLSSTANDQLVQFSSGIRSLTLTNKSGNTVTLLGNVQWGIEFIDVNGRIEPQATVSVPQDVYTSASVSTDGGSFVCLALAPNGNMVRSIFEYTTPFHDVAVTLPHPISVAGSDMGLSLDALVSESVTFGNCNDITQSFTVSPTFSLQPVTLSLQPTNATNGKAVGLHGIVNSVDSGGAAFILSAMDFASWQVMTSAGTKYQGIAGPSQLTAGMPVDMDAAVQPDGSLLASRISVFDMDVNDLSVSIGPLLNTNITYPGLPTGLLAADPDAVRGLLPLNGTYYDYRDAAFQTSAQLTNLQKLPFLASFTASNMAPGQRVTVTTHDASLPETRGTYISASTVTLVPQTINGTIGAVGSESGFTTYTIALAPYDLFPTFDSQPGQVLPVTDPATIVVYADSNTQMLNTSPIAVGSVARFYGLVFNDNGTLRMDCAQINDGVPE
jgi:Domain of unknown function (DUF5666)